MITQTIRRTYEFVFLRPKGVPEWTEKAIKARTRKAALAYAKQLGFQPEEMIELRTFEDFFEPPCMDLMIEPTLAEEYAEKKEERRLRKQRQKACS